MHRSIEIVAGAVCRDLTVLDTAKLELGIPLSDVSSDDQIAVLIKQASSIVAAYCDQVFAQETIIETFWSDTHAEWTKAFMLSREPVTEIISVEIDGAVLDPSEYRLATDGYVHRVDAVVGGICQWTWTASAIISYTSGYLLLDDLPYGIERATLMLIKDYWSNIGADPRLRSEDIPGVRSVTYAVSSAGAQSSLSPDVVALLQPYRRMVFA